MANLISQVEVYTTLNNLMGRRNLPGGSQDDLKRFCQYAMDYCWRYYTWGFSVSRGTVDLSTDAYMPEDFDLDGYHRVASLPGESWTYVPIEEHDSLTAGDRYYTLEYIKADNRYKFVTSSTATSVEVIYQTIPPTLGEAPDVPFPSSMVVALGGIVYAKQAENPNSADVNQEWDQFHSELDRLVARSDTNKPKRTVQNRQDRAGTFTGDVGAY